eukprot:scaffold11500_cov117-Isochrysis_galbana.AAC.8
MCGPRNALPRQPLGAIPVGSHVRVTASPAARPPASGRAILGVVRGVPVPPPVDPRTVAAIGGGGGPRARAQTRRRNRHGTNPEASGDEQFQRVGLGELGTQRRLGLGDVTRGGEERSGRALGGEAKVGQGGQCAARLLRSLLKEWG